MSRTFRRTVDWYWHARGHYYTMDECHELDDEAVKRCGARSRVSLPYWEHPTLGWVGKDFYHKRGRDKKRWNKPPKWFKQQQRRIERARINNAMRHEDYENIPVFKHGDAWLWT
jgi:hypothetical protein